MNGDLAHTSDALDGTLTVPDAPRYFCRRLVASPRSADEMTVAWPSIDVVAAATRRA